MKYVVFIIMAVIFTYVLWPLSWADALFVFLGSYIVAGFVNIMLKTNIFIAFQNKEDK